MSYMSEMFDPSFATDGAHHSILWPPKEWDQEWDPSAQEESAAGLSTAMALSILDAGRDGFGSAAYAQKDTPTTAGSPSEAVEKPRGGTPAKDERLERSEWSERAERRARGGARQKEVVVLETPVNYTTVMLRNIPNKYTREMLVQQLSIDFAGTFNFLYLPVDFKNRCNLGYGFINFLTPEICANFVSKFHGLETRKCLPGPNSKKIAQVSPARVQGLVENVRRLKNSPVMGLLLANPEWTPLMFSKDGLEEPFPLPEDASTGGKQPRMRTRNRPHH